MTKQKVVGYRVCRVQRFNINGIVRDVFTLPANSREFRTVRQAFDHASEQFAIRTVDSWFWIQSMFSDGTFDETPKSAAELGLEPVPPPPPLRIQYRICRIERVDGRYIFTLPMSTRRYDSVKEAHAFLQNQTPSTWVGGPGNSNQYWIQEIENGKFGETPRTLEELEQSNPTATEIEDKLDSEPAQETPEPEWAKAWGYQKPVLRGDT
jgi:hypothetical protein